MNFRTQIEPQAGPFKIEYKDSIFFMGSCFAEHIASQMKASAFLSLSNPFGVLFHPIAIENAVGRIASKMTYSNEELAHRDDVFFSWDHNHSFSHTIQDRCLGKINANLREAHQHLSQTKVCIISLGTAFAYKLKREQEFVANCHKMPRELFEKHLLSVKEILDSLENTLITLQIINKEIKCILTISPVRHLKDGFVENNLSKSRLIDAVQQFCTLRRKDVHYFPAYEIMLDDLRDYRFYTEDLIHPNQQAVDYIYHRFKQSYFTNETLVFRKKQKSCLTD